MASTLLFFRKSDNTTVAISVRSGDILRWENGALVGGEDVSNNRDAMTLALSRMTIDGIKSLFERLGLSVRFTGAQTGRSRASQAKKIDWIEAFVQNWECIHQHAQAKADAQVVNEGYVSAENVVADDNSDETESIHDYISVNGEDGEYRFSDAFLRDGSCFDDDKDDFVSIAIYEYHGRRLFTISPHYNLTIGEFKTEIVLHIQEQGNTKKTLSEQCFFLECNGMKMPDDHFVGDYFEKGTDTIYEATMMLRLKGGAVKKNTTKKSSGVAESHKKKTMELAQSVSATMKERNSVKALETILSTFMASVETNPIKAFEDLFKEKSSQDLAVLVEKMKEVSGGGVDDRLVKLAPFIFGNAMSSVVDEVKSLNAVCGSAEHALVWAFRYAQELPDTSFNLGRLKTIVQSAYDRKVGASEALASHASVPTVGELTASVADMEM
eukprot:symbB.v1.2.038063.t1/scaffold5804.1/size30335/2